MKIEVKGISKAFEDNKALDNISFNIEGGKAFGILGRNGAGKTTFIRILLGIMNEDSGEILIDGKSIRDSKLKFGYLPEERGLYLKYKVCDQLLYFAELNGLKKKEAEKIIREHLKLFKIEEYYNKKIEELSKGNKQKIQLIAAIIHDPDIIVLDEPFSGLDPVNVELFKEVIKNLLKNKKTIIFSSHQMNNVEEFCDYVILLKKGEIKLQGRIEDIKDYYGSNKVKIKVSSDIDKLVTTVELKVINKEDNEYTLQYEKKKEVDKLVRSISKENISIDKLSYVKPSLNEIFISELGD